MKRILQLTAVAACVAVGNYSNAQIVDGGFEAGPGGGTWTESSTNFGTPLCDLGTCGDCGGPCGPNQGSYYAWFGGANAIEQGAVEQTTPFPSGTTASIDMMVYIAGAGDGLVDDKLEVSVDGNILGTITALDSATYGAGYTAYSVDVSSLADGASHAVKIEGFQSTTTVFNILVDDVVLMVDGAPAVGLFEAPAVVDFTVYPNPAQDVINLNFGDLNGATTVRILAVDGSVITEQEISSVSNKNFSFNTADMNNGVYFVEVENDGNVTAERVVVAK